MPAPNSQTPPQLWTLALSHFQAGRLSESEVAYRQFLALLPGHAGAHYNLAVTLKALGRLEEAATHYRRALAVRPDNAKAHNNLGVILAIQARNLEAVAHYRRALAILPDYANAHYNLANILREQGDAARAIDHYRRALIGKPDDPETHNNLGIALAAAGQADEAIRHYRRALALRSDYADAYSNLGSALEAQGRMEDAMASYAKALQLNPAHADAHYNLGHALYAQEKVGEAETHYERALALDPMHAEAHNNYGLLSQGLGRTDEALARYARAQDLKPAYADAHWNEALARLLLGDFATGWRKYEWRWRRKETPPRMLAAPLWDGSTLAGKTILLHAEQGTGDTIQFIRYASLVKAQGGDVVFECPPALRRLLDGMAGVDHIVPAGGTLPPFDVHAPLLSLPALLGTTLETLPANVPYLHPDPDRVQAWRERLSGLAQLKVGLVWQGNPAHSNDRSRSIPVSTMGELTVGTDIDWVSLQVDARPDEIKAFGSASFYDAGAQLDDWVDTAAAISALDLVVTVDTAVAHLAGALGKPAWILLPFAPDWRWLLDRSDSPWYPTVRLFRQPSPGSWPPVIRRLRTALAHRGAAAEVAPPEPASAPAVLAQVRRLAPVMVVSHERSGTHFLMNALSYAYGYTAEPWIDLDVHNRAVDLSSPGRIAASLQALADDPLLRIVKSHHAAEVFGAELERVTQDYTVFYIHRDPAAVMTSLWRHLNGLGWDEGPKTVDPLALAQAEPIGRLRRYQARRHETMLQRWAAHVRGWLTQADMNSRIIPVRYEELDSDYEMTVATFADAVGRAPLKPFLRPPRDVNVISGGAEVCETRVPPALRSALVAHCSAELGSILERVGHGPRT